MDRLVIYSPAELADSLFAAVGREPVAQWRARVLKSAAGMLKSRPAVYRTFGPWWWPLKAQLIKAGLMPEGEVDDQLLAAVTTGDADRDIIGAIAYHGYNMDTMRIGNTFSVETDKGDTIEYLLHDAELEARIVAGG